MSDRNKTEKVKISDPELLALTKCFSHSEISEKLGVTRSAVSQKLKRIQRDNALLTQRLIGHAKKSDKNSVVIRPQSNSAKDLIDLASSLLLKEKEKDLRSTEIIKISESLGRIAKMQAEIYQSSYIRQGVCVFRRVVLEEINKLAPSTAQKIAEKLLSNSELRWMLDEVQPEVTERKNIATKKTEKCNKNNATFDHASL